MERNVMNLFQNVCTKDPYSWQDEKLRRFPTSKYIIVPAVLIRSHSNCRATRYHCAAPLVPLPSSRLISFETIPWLTESLPRLSSFSIMPHLPSTPSPGRRTRSATQAERDRANQSAQIQVAVSRMIANARPEPLTPPRTVRQYGRRRRVQQRNLSPPSSLSSELPMMSDLLTDITRRLPSARRQFVRQEPTPIALDNVDNKLEKVS